MPKGAAVEVRSVTLYKGFLTGMRNCPPDDSDAIAQFNSKAGFEDDIESLPTVEPAVDPMATSRWRSPVRRQACSEEAAGRKPSGERGDG